MRPGLFITGTDTNAGKTVLSAAVMHRYRPVMPVCYWKPVQTGSPEDDDTGVVRALGGCAPNEVYDRGVRLPRPLSPHLSARLSGAHIDVAGVLRMAAPGNGWVVEGAGGVLVPLNEHELMIELMVALGMAVLVATRTTLGTINHTLLTIEALRARAIPIAGVVMIGDANRNNREAIETYGSVSVLGEMPRFGDLSAETLAAWSRDGLDRESRLERYLR